MSQHDDRVIEILDELTRRLREGSLVSLDEAVRQYPEVAEELRELWPAVLMAETMGLPQGGEQPILSPLPPARRDGRLPSLADYELVEELGRGGMGVVYRARQKSLNRDVAIKMLLPGAQAVPANLIRFQGESKAAAKLDHPHIVPVFEVGESDGQPFFAMQYVGGTTLAKRISEGPIGQRETAGLLAAVCRAVAFAHDRGILHRDLKPSNILLDEAGRPMITDFGLAKQLPVAGAGQVEAASVTEAGAILGTPGYMAPEQAAGFRGQVCAATDVYSLGAVLYACVTGRAPFQASTPMEAVMMILEQDPPPPRLLNPRLDADLEMIILKAMQKPVDLRYSSASALANDLDAYLNNEPVSARSSQFLEVLSRAFRPTHHAAVLKNWGVLWMWHALVLLALCLVTDWLRGRGVTTRLPYLGLWTIGLGAWAFIFWNLRRRAGPVTFVERQIAHVWASSMACSTALFGVEYLLGLPVLTLSPVLALFAGAVFTVKAGILSGEFYFPAALLYLTSIPMALYPRHALTFFGVASALTFFTWGWKFQRQRSGVQS